MFCFEKTSSVKTVTSRRSNTLYWLFKYMCIWTTIRGKGKRLTLSGTLPWASHAHRYHVGRSWGGCWGPCKEGADPEAGGGGVGAWQPPPVPRHLLCPSRPCRAALLLTQAGLGGVATLTPFGIQDPREWPHSNVLKRDFKCTRQYNQPLDLFNVSREQDGAPRHRSAMFTLIPSSFSHSEDVGRLHENPHCGPTATNISPLSSLKWHCIVSSFPNLQHCPKVQNEAYEVLKSLQNRRSLRKSRGCISASVEFWPFNK